MTMDRALPSPSMAKNIERFFAFRLLATSYLFVPIFMLFQAARGLTFFERLALGGLFSAVVILVEVPTGVFADRVGRRRSMTLGALAMVASCLVAARASSFATFAIAEAVAAISIALCSGADSAYLFDLLAARGRASEYPRHESIASACHLLGSAAAFAGGGLLGAVDLALPYYATACVAALAAAIAWRLDEEPRRVASPQRIAWRSQTANAITTVARNGRLLWIVGYSAIVFMLLRATIYLYQPYLEARGLGAAAIGALFAGVYVIGAFVAFKTHQLRRRFGDDALLWGVLAVLSASFVGLAGAMAGPWMLSLLVVQAIANGVSSPLTKPILNAEIVDSSQRAAILSVESMARRIAMGVFAPLVGLYGEADVMLLCGGVGIAGMVLLALSRGSRQRSPVDSVSS